MKRQRLSIYLSVAGWTIPVASCVFAIISGRLDIMRYLNAVALLLLIVGGYLSLDLSAKEEREDPER